MGETLLVLDEGTTSTRAMLFAPSGECLGSHSAELTQHYPGPGLVEHDAAEIWTRTLACGRAMVEKAGGAERIAAIGITNQRETIVFWDKTTGEPLAPAIVWQDRRSAALCRQWRDAGEEPGVQARTGLLLDPYFSGTKIAWAMANWPQLKDAGDRLAIGTIESWLVWKLTGGVHITDATNASRTLLMGLGSGGWSDGLLDMFSAPRDALPEIVDCAGRFGTTYATGDIESVDLSKRPFTLKAGDRTSLMATLVEMQRSLGQVVVVASGATQMERRARRSRFSRACRRGSGYARSRPSSARGRRRAGGRPAPP